VLDKGEDCSGVDMRERHSGRENRLDLLEIRDPGGGPGNKLEIVTKAAAGGALVWVAMDRNFCKKLHLLKNHWSTLTPPDCG
jgi:hypothetical protein